MHVLLSEDHERDDHGVRSTSDSEAGTCSDEGALVARDPFVRHASYMLHPKLAISSVLAFVVGCTLLVAISIRQVPQSKQQPVRTADIIEQFKIEKMLKLGMVPHTGTWLKGPQREAGVKDELEPLGQGFCIDLHGNKFEGLDAETGSSWMTAEVGEAGESQQCREKCLQDSDCTGYATLGSGTTGKCGLVKNGLPSGADGTDGGHCFWKHQFLRNSTAYKGNPKSIPKIIWGFWENMPHDDEHTVPTTLPPLIEACVESWVQLNPDWDVRLLNLSTMLDWISMDDLPSNFEGQSIQHKSDAVRIAALAKYGGVYIDASVFLLQPLAKVLPDDSRIFWNLDTRAAFAKYDNRVNWTHFVENSFMATPANDAFFKSVHECVKIIQVNLGTIDVGIPFSFTHLFNKEQLEQLKTLGIYQYLSMHACFLKAMTDDAAIWQWYNGRGATHVDAGKAACTLNFKYGWEMKGAYKIRHELFSTTSASLMQELTTPEVKMIKMRENVRKAMLNLTRKELWCTPSTFHNIIKSIGIHDSGFCSLLDEAV